ncbi:hypothetical protein IE02_2836 [Fibrobacter succinogenes subsp. elongatus]|uniref:Uncharacterized protein n=1 Tax=Fibrobacter succinogenes TaxID=833 RepID=A0A380SA71_FIBSU|nr:hypothetical protein IE02_2836 [Fibrobacter succinogenes subsp. elongatus]SUQ26031.1 hypothetical protein SAMN05661053_2836 [Fibrobacter succinogenes]
MRLGLLSAVSGRLFGALPPSVENLTLSFAIFGRPPNGVSGSGGCQACVTEGRAGCAIQSRVYGSVDPKSGNGIYK